MTKYYIGIITVAVIFLIAIVYGFSYVGGPATNRDRKFDQQRVTYLNTASREIDSFYEKHSRPPSTLREMRLSWGGSPEVDKDPETKQEYEYTVLGIDKYRLCGVFKISTEREPNYDGPRSFRRHPQGRYCLDLEISETVKAKLLPTATPLPIIYKTACGKYTASIECVDANKRGEKCGWYECPNGQKFCLTFGTDAQEVCSRDVSVIVP